MLTPFQSNRWLACRNMNDPAETIPGFALLKISGQHVVERQVVFSVVCPDAAAERRQNPAELLFNGPTPIPPGAFGTATQDFPARVLHAARAEPPPAACGPRAGSYHAHPEGRAFSVVGPDASGASLPPGSELLWVTRAAAEPLVYGAAARVSLAEIPSGGVFEPLADVYRDFASDGLPQGVYAAPGGLACSISGSYLVGFSLSLYSSTAPRGAQLVVRLYRDEAPTQYYALRLQDVERDEYGADLLTSIENVCLAGPLPLAAGQRLALRNESNYPIVAAPATLWAALLFRHEAPSANQDEA